MFAFIHPFIYLSTHISIHPSIFPFIHPSILCIYSAPTQIISMFIAVHAQFWWFGKAWSSIHLHCHGDMSDCSTMYLKYKFYGVKIVRYLCHQQLQEKWWELLELPPEQQSLETGEEFCHSWAEFGLCIWNSTKSWLCLWSQKGHSCTWVTMLSLNLLISCVPFCIV